jgi:hypothetical protein
MVTSSSVDSGSQKEESQPGPVQNQSLAPKNGISDSNERSPRAEAVEDHYDMVQQKTVEQHERINRELAGLLRNAAQNNNGGGKPTNPDIGHRQSTPAE